MDNPELATHLLIHGYDLIKPIGKGASASVFLVKSHKYTELFVAKYIPSVPGRKSEPAVQVNALLSLSHPYIINMYESFSEQDILYIILEYCPGGSVKDQITKNGKIHDKILQAYCRQLGSALKYCHDLNIGHRDIKPANLLLDRYGRIKLADFGLSQLVSTDDNDYIACGTPAYMAPEILNQFPSVDIFKADMWSYGVTIYEMAVGIKPWNGSIDKMKAKMLLGIEKPKVRNNSLCKLLRALLNPNPIRRVSIDQALEFEYFGETSFELPRKKSDAAITEFFAPVLLQSPFKSLNQFQKVNTSRSRRYSNVHRKLTFDDSS